jgi:hypothetical protein
VLFKSPFLIKWKEHMYSMWVKDVSTSSSRSPTYQYITGRLPHEFVCRDTINVLFKYLMCEGKVTSFFSFKKKIYLFFTLFLQLGFASLLRDSLVTYPYRTIHVNISTTVSYDLIVEVSVSTVFQPSSMSSFQWNHFKEKDLKTFMTSLGFNIQKEMQWRTCSYLSSPTLHMLNPWMTRNSLFQ